MVLRLGFLEDGAAGDLEPLGGDGGEPSDGVLHEVVLVVVPVGPGQSSVDLKWRGGECY